MLKGIKEQYLNNPLFPRAIPIVISVWILSLTAYYCINTPWLSLFSGWRPDTNQLIAETLKFHWVPVFLSRLPYVFYALILNFIAMLIGNGILRWLKADFNSNINKIIFSIPLGWGIYSIGIFYLGISGLLYKEAVYGFLTLLGVISILELKRYFEDRKVKRQKGCFTSSPLHRFTSLPYRIDKTDLIFLPIIIIFITIQFVISFSPIWSNDAQTYHMALPKLYIKHHALVHVPGFFFSTLPAHTEMLYLLGLITSGETLSKLFSFSISVMFLITIFSFGNRYFSKVAGYLGVVIILPVRYFSSLFSESHADTALGLFSLLGIYAFFMWIEGLSSNELKERKACPEFISGDGYLYLSIIFCALSAATKIQGLFFVLLFFVGFLVTLTLTLPHRGGGKGGGKRLLKRLAWCILIVGIIALPWYVRSWWLTGDPVFPFLYDYLGAKHWNKYANECFRDVSSHPAIGGAKSFSEFIRINKNLFFSGSWSSSLSPIIVIFLIPAFITLMGKNEQVSLKASPQNLHLIILPTIFVYYIFFICTSPQIRFFYVGHAILSIIVAHFIKTVWTKYLFIRLPTVLCIVVLSAASFFGFEGRDLEGPFFAGLGVLDQRQFLNERVISYRVASWVNENLPKDSKILSVDWRRYYIDREYMLIHPVFQGVLVPC